MLALRAIGAFTDADGGQSVPFYLQPTLGGHRDLRGFRESRFRDQNTLLLGAEYRWQAWWALDGALFVDAGTVAPTRRGLSLSNMESLTASGSASTVTVHLSVGSTWRSVAKVSCRC